MDLPALLKVPSLLFAEKMMKKSNQILSTIQEKQKKPLYVQ